MAFLDKAGGCFQNDPAKINKAIPGRKKRDDIREAKISIHHPAGAFLSLDGITKRFGDFRAVDRLTLEIRPGEVFALLGPSGCGKSTTLRQIAGLDQPDEGSIRLRDAVLVSAEEDVFVLPCECGWSDVGSWESLYELKRQDRDSDENLATGDVLAIDCRRSHISAAGDRLVACLGLESCLVVDTPDVLLVADLKRSQEIRKIVDRLDTEKRYKLL